MARIEAKCADSKLLRVAILALLGSSSMFGFSGTAEAQSTASGGVTTPAPSPSTANQSAPTPPSQQDGVASAEDIIVTASRYQQTLQTTPLAVSALNASALQARGVTDVAGLATEVPTLQVGTNGANSSVDISIRGITSNNTNAYSGNPAVATYVNGVYVPRTQGLNEALFDVERVEVLRGPQGTLYGRNSTAGAVNIITAKPSQHFEFAADGSYGNYNTVLGHVMVNLPASDTLAFRVVAFGNRDDGYQNTNGATKNNYFRAQEFGGRISALWRPSEKLSVLLQSDYFQDTGAPNFGVATPIPGTAYPVQLSPDPYHPQVTPGQEPSENVRVFNVRANIDYNFTDNLSLSYIGGYGTVHLSTFVDSDGRAVASGTSNFVDDERNTSQEVDLRFTNHKLKLVGGGNFNYEKDRGDLAVEALQATGFAPQQLQFPHLNFVQRSYGFFGQGTYSVSDRFRVTGGLRYSHDYVENPGAGTLFCVHNTPNFAPTDSTSCNRFSAFNYTPRQFHKLTWKAGVEYDVAQASLLYASVSTGYKQGALNAVSALVTAPIVRPETVTNYEAGLKNRFFGGALTLNASVFYMKYRDLQVQQVVFVSVTPPITTNITTNAAKASIYGAELEAVVKVSPVDHITGFMSYLHARYDEFLNANDPSTDPGNLNPLNLSGNTLIRSPSFSARVSYAHDFKLSSGGRITPQLSFFYQTKTYLREFNNSFDTQGGYTKTDFKLTYESVGGHWTIDAFVQNIENRAVRVAEYGTGSALLSYYAPPRRYGLRVAFKY